MNLARIPVSEGIEKLVGNQSDSLEVLAVLPEKEFGEACPMAEEWGEVAPLIVEKNVDRVLPDNEEETRSERGDHDRDCQPWSEVQTAVTHASATLRDIKALALHSVALPSSVVEDMVPVGRAAVKTCLANWSNVPVGTFQNGRNLWG